MFLSKARKGSFFSAGILLSSLMVVAGGWWLGEERGERRRLDTPLMAYFCLLSCLNLSGQEKLNWFLQGNKAKRRSPSLFQIDTPSSRSK